MNNRIYYVIIDDKQEGPFTLEQLHELNLTRNTLVWHEGLESWTALELIKDLEGLFLSLPPVYVKSEITQQVRNVVSFKLPKTAGTGKVLNRIFNYWYLYLLLIFASFFMTLLFNEFLKENVYDINKYDNPEVVKKIVITDTRRKLLPSEMLEPGPIIKFKELPPDLGGISISGLELSDFPFSIHVENYSDLDYIFRTRKEYFQDEAYEISVKVFIWLSVFLWLIFTIVIISKGSKR